jgi:hypothetical protein
VDAEETNAPIEADRPVTDPEIELAVTQAPEPADEPGNPDSWLQWAVVFGILALFLVCAVLILIAWNDR